MLRQQYYTHLYDGCQNPREERWPADAERADKDDAAQFLIGESSVLIQQKLSRFREKFGGDMIYNEYYILYI